MFTLLYKRAHSTYHKVTIFIFKMCSTVSLSVIFIYLICFVCVQTLLLSLSINHQCSQVKLSFDVFCASIQKLRSQISCHWSFLLTSTLLLLHLYAAILGLKEAFLISTAIVCIIFNHVLPWLMETFLSATKDC